MRYIVHRRFRGNALPGYVNLPARTVCECKGGVITFNGCPVCYATSENAHKYFCRDDDGQGMLRGNLTHAIQNRLQKHDSSYRTRWDKIWQDPLCLSYKRPEHADHFIWNNAFFNADIKDLQYIARLINAKGA